MAIKVKVAGKRSFKDRMIDFVRAKDEEGARKALEGVEVADDEGAGQPDEGGDTHVHIHVGGEPEAKDDAETPAEEAAPAWFKAYSDKNDARVGAIEETLAKLAPAKAADDVVPADKPEENKDLVTDEELKTEPDGSKIADAEMEPDGEKDPLKSADKKTRDAAMKSDFQDAVSRAELILPGLKLPTFDAANAAAATCLFRRRVLYRASTKHGASTFVDAVLGKGFDLKTMPCDAVKVAFNAVAELARTSNNGAVRTGTYDRSHSTVTIPSLADMNKRNREFWAKQPGGGASN